MKAYQEQQRLISMMPLVTGESQVWSEFQVALLLLLCLPMHHLIQTHFSRAALRLN